MAAVADEKLKKAMSIVNPQKKYWWDKNPCRYKSDWAICHNEQVLNANQNASQIFWLRIGDHFLSH